jgi:CheY-like chemotaxis protein
MDIWSDPAFDKSILGIAQAYGPYEFWTQNLQPGMNPIAAWRALLLVAAMKDRKFAPNARNLLGNDDSRVRAWACFALAHLKEDAAVEQIMALRDDISPRVRFHARRAAQVILNRPVPPGRPSLGDDPIMPEMILLSSDNSNVQTYMEVALKAKGYRLTSAATEQETMQAALLLRPLAIVTDNQKGRDNLSGLNMTWDICRIPELRETVLFMLSADYVEVAFLWGGGDCFIHKGDLVNPGKPVVDYLAG